MRRRGQKRGPYGVRQALPLAEDGKPADPFAHALREARLDAFMSQDELADKMGVARTSVAHWERGGRKMSWDLKDKLHAALPASRDWPLHRGYGKGRASYPGVIVWKETGNALPE